MKRDKRDETCKVVAGWGWEEGPTPTGRVGSKNFHKLDGPLQFKQKFRIFLKIFFLNKNYSIFSSLWIFR